jgi:hypothetical protein
MGHQAEIGRADRPSSMSVRQLQANEGLTSASTECSSWQAMFFMTDRLSGLTIECILRSIPTGFFQTVVNSVYNSGRWSEQVQAEQPTFDKSEDSHWLLEFCLASILILNMEFKDDVPLKGDHLDNAAHENSA